MNTFARFDQRSLILEILRKHDISIGSFSRLQFETDLPRWTVERILNGDRLDQSDTAKLYRLAKCIDDLAQRFPVPLDWTEAATLRDILRQKYAQQQTGSSFDGATRVSETVDQIWR
jgi:hypothetical protein